MEIIFASKRPKKKTSMGGEHEAEKVAAHESCPGMHGKYYILRYFLTALVAILDVHLWF